jgi:nucleoside-diphosphate-sugar epimerase
MNVLVTGGAGYLGAVLVPRLLDEGHRVTVLDSLVHGQASLLHVAGHRGLEFLRGDARDETVLTRCLKQADAIVPLAAVVGAPACARDPWRARSVNLDAIHLLLRHRSPSQLIVFPTTNSGYGATAGDTPCTEDTPLRPISLYGETKAQAEGAVLDAGNAITLRLATVFGVSPRMRLDLLVNHFVYAAVTDGYLVVFEKHFKRNFVHVEDVADCFLHCLANGRRMSGQCYNFGLDAANLSKAELATKIQEQVPGFHVEFAEIGSDPDQRNYVVSNGKIAAAGMVATRTLDAGIAALIQAYRMMNGARDTNA